MTSKSKTKHNYRVLSSNIKGTVEIIFSRIGTADRRACHGHARWAEPFLLYWNAGQADATEVEALVASGLVTEKHLITMVTVGSITVFAENLGLFDVHRRRRVDASEAISDSWDLAPCVLDRWDLAELVLENPIA